AFRAEPAKNVIPVRLQEDPIFEEAQQSETQHDGRGDAPPALARTRARSREPAANVIHRRDEEHERHEPGIPPAVKNVARDEQPRVTPGRTRGQGVVTRQHERQEVEDENVGGEDHVVSPGLFAPQRTEARKGITEVGGSLVFHRSLRSQNLRGAMPSRRNPSLILGALKFISNPSLPPPSRNLLRNWASIRGVTSATLTTI